MTNVGYMDFLAFINSNIQFKNKKKKNDTFGFYKI